MANSFWLVIKSPENYRIAKERNFDMVGLIAHHRRKVQRMAPGDRALLYIAKERCWGASATVTTAMVEDHSPIWRVEGGSDFPYRVGIKPNIVLDPSQHIDAYQLAPRMDFTRRWTPELWYLAFQGSLHLISKFDFTMVEEEMRKQKRGRGPRARSFKVAGNGAASRCKLEARGDHERGSLVRP